MRVLIPASVAINVGKDRYPVVARAEISAANCGCLPKASLTRRARVVLRRA
ncbi:hypothetical protein P3102_25455 [Amycolatopsis sp. QT-25]|uniref:hypothetical protein n=1 Tax=Amycolatopsis sp. QT-25 TaxID=3034022 RepID=UPI0023EB7DAC|nr:hypothetical protein [Amycolatopsis sp. QT-25]WET77419.1 hypothetical protein P3102_25455 [Amycolatopsis sp. QT-25]